MQVERASHPRIHVARAGPRAASAPAPRSAPRAARRAPPARPARRARSSIGGRDRLGRGRQRPQLGGLDPAAEPLELDDPVVGGAGLALVAAAVGQHDEAVAVGRSPAACPRGRPSSTSLPSSTECRKTLRIVPSKVLMLSTKTTRFGAAELAEEPRREQRDLVARLELALVLELALLGPRRQEQRQHDDRERKTAPRTTGSAAGTSASAWPEVNQTIISLSRYQRDSVSSTVRNTVTESRILK